MLRDTGTSRRLGLHVKNEIIITFEENYIQACSNGKKSIEFATKLWTEITNACKKHECFNVLGIANTTAPVNTIDAVNHVELFQNLDITRKYRIAWVELNPEAADMAHLVERLLSSHKVTCRVFSDIAEAKKWLFFGRDA